MVDLSTRALPFKGLKARDLQSRARKGRAALRGLLRRRLGAHWLVLPLALPLFLALGLATGTAINLGLSGEWIGRQDTGRLSAAEAQVELASGPAGVEACGRIQNIVETACGLRQHDHDRDGIRQCVSYELKYTLWSAYGCN
jgi:hypothetical protein